jgi:hypothetical protein
MRIKITGTVLLPLLLLLMPLWAGAQDGVGSGDLIEKASLYDGVTVVYGGEVVGDMMYRGDYAWIGISDGANTVSVYIPAAEAKKITHVGGYRVVGDTVQITGVFHRACAEHGGDLDIHANSVEIVQAGHTVEDDPSSGLTAAAGVLFAFAAGGVILVIRRRMCYNNIT